MALDIAQQTELALLERQKPMNAVIDRGDSDVQQFYRDAVVLLTGGSGFLGKQFVEKLFRSCDIKKIYLLLRPKKGKTIAQRLAYILKDPLYDSLREKKPDFDGRIVPLEGDVAELRLGLTEKDWDNITKEVNIIVHMAATVNFQAPLHIAGITNVRGTRELLELGRQCHNLKLFNHVSTAFAHATVPRINNDVKEQFYPCPVAPDVFLDMIASIDEERLTNITPALFNHVSTAFAHATVPRIDNDVKEQFYPCPVAPDVFLDMIASIDEERLTNITPALLKDWPNTYTFTKAIAEELVRISASDLPICIVKPPVVSSSFVEPSPGWIDNKTVMSSVMGFLLGIGMGLIHVMPGKKDLVVSFAPVDYANNAIIAAGWDSVQNRQHWGGDIPIYIISCSRSEIKWGDLSVLIRNDEFFRLSTPKSVWYIYCIETNNRVIYWLLTWFLHYIPGYFLDAVVSMLDVRPKGVPLLTNVYNRVDNMLEVYRYFLSNNWNIRDDNLQSMITRLSPADKAIYTCDVGQLAVKDVMKAFCVGLRRFIIKDGLVGSDVGYRKQQWLFYANIVFLSLYAYCIWKLVILLWSGLAVLFSIYS